MGRFNEQKNLPLLLDACRLVPGSRLLLVGTGPSNENSVNAPTVYRLTLQAWCQIPSCRVCSIRPSRLRRLALRGVSQGTLGGHGLRLPVVGTDVAGTREAIANGVNGLLCRSYLGLPRRSIASVAG